MERQVGDVRPMNALVRKAFSGPLESQEFVRKSRTWYAEREETVLVAQIQPSSYGSSYYVNLAVYLKQLGDLRFPREEQCHIRIRLSSLAGGTVDRVLDFEHGSMDDVKRASVLRAAMLDHGIPFLEECSTLKGIRRAIRAKRLSDAFVHKEVKRLASEA